MRRLALTGLLLLLVGIVVAPARGEQYILTGGGQTLWLVRSGSDLSASTQGEAHFEIAYKQADKQWKYATRKPLSGQPRAAVAGNDRLGLLFGPPLVYLTVDTEGTSTFLPNPREGWPDDASPLLAVHAGGYGGSSNSAVLVGTWVNARGKAAAVPQTQTATAATAPATEPADADTQPATVLGRSPESLQALRLLLFDQAQWEKLPDLPVGPMSTRPRVLATGTAKNVWVLLDGEETNQLWVLTEGQWQRRPLEEPVRTAEFAGLVNLGDQAIAVAAITTGEDQRHLTMIELSAQDGPTVTPLREGEARLSWPDGPLPMVARLGDAAKIYLVWAADGKLMERSVSAGGQVAPANDVSVFDTPPPSDLGERIIFYFNMALLLLVLAPLFFIRPRTPAKPFALPTTMKPGNLLKRLAAALIDLLPIGMIVTAVLSLFLELPRELPDVQEAMRQQTPPVAHAVALVVWLSIYGIYSILMEWRLGATLGKMLMKLKVVGDEGRPPGLREAALRNMTKIIVLMTWPMTVLLMLPLFNRYRQRLGDIVARTTVIDAHPAATRPRPPQPREPLDDRGRYEQDTRESRQEQTPPADKRADTRDSAAEGPDDQTRDGGE
jgi:uncharacterized RDD family membrane protein YckC